VNRNRLTLTVLETVNSSGSHSFKTNPQLSIHHAVEYSMLNAELESKTADNNAEHTVLDGREICDDETQSLNHGTC